MDETAFNAAIEGTEKHYDVNCRQVSNGFSLAGNVRYMVPGTSNVKIAQTFEAVALDSAGAATAIAHFLTTGTFA
jgi:ribosomal protein L32E